MPKFVHETSGVCDGCSADQLPVRQGFAEAQSSAAAGREEDGSLNFREGP